ncbi:MAG: glycosidase [Caldithrix sp.]|nr:glycosidase [Caldithrix sp.]
MEAVKLNRINEIILEPIAEHPWESRAVFNPGTVRDGRTVHMLYRAVEGDNFSTIGYARVNAKGEVIHRSSNPVIFQDLEMEKQGCEDPRIVPFNDTYYIFYTGFDGYCASKSINTRIMMAETKDFSSYHKIGMIGPDVQDKDAMIFPETVKGKVVLIHRVVPNIQLAYFDDLQHMIHPEPQYWPAHLDRLHEHTLMFPEHFWESTKIGAGPPPIRTDAGWLLIYHGVDKDMVYRAGAVLLDEHNPSKLIARLPYPILEPITPYERKGDVDMVVFPEGIIQFDDELQIYYGAADKVIGMASVSLRKLLDALWQHKVR